MQIIRFGDKENVEKYMTVHVLDFNDDYHKNEDTNDELLSKVKGIRRRYKSIMAYNEAVSLVDSYTERLIEKYDGETNFIMLLRAGMVEDYIPPIPKIKDNKKMRALLSSGMPISEPLSKHVDLQSVFEYLADQEIDLDEVKIEYTERFDKSVVEGMPDVMKAIQRDDLSDKIYTGMTTYATVQQYFANSAANKQQQRILDEFDLSEDDKFSYPFYEGVRDDGMDNKVVDDVGFVVTSSGNIISNKERHINDYLEMMKIYGHNTLHLAKQLGNANILNNELEFKAREKAQRKAEKKARKNGGGNIMSDQDWFNDIINSSSFNLDGGL